MFNGAVDVIFAAAVVAIFAAAAAIIVYAALVAAVLAAAAVLLLLLVPATLIVFLRQGKVLLYNRISQKINIFLNICKIYLVLYITI